jgi:hypothetical protein
MRGQKQPELGSMQVFSAVVFIITLLAYSRDRLLAAEVVTCDDDLSGTRKCECGCEELALSAMGWKVSGWVSFFVSLPGINCFPRQGVFSKNHKANQHKRLYH